MKAEGWALAWFTFILCALLGYAVFDRLQHRTEPPTITLSPEPETFRKLDVYGYVRFDRETKTITIAHPVLCVDDKNGTPYCSTLKATTKEWR